MIRLFGHRFQGAAIVLTFFFAAGPAPASAATALTVGEANATADNIMPLTVGDDLGIFKKHGLELKIIELGGGSKMAQAMAAGSIDIGLGAGTELALMAKGAPALAVCETSGPVSFFGVGVPWDSPIKSLADLKGKTIGVSSLGSLTEWLAHELANKEGWGERGVTTVALGGSAAAIVAAFRVHQVDAAMGTTTEFLSFEERQAGRLLASVSSYEGNAASGIIEASNHLIATDPDAIRAFIAAWLETIDYVRTHKADTVKRESVIGHFDEQIMDHEYDLTIGMFTKDCRFDAESLATLKRSFVALKLLDSEPDMSKLYTEEFLPK
jgi:ABC-type nitrate/sulfonate/bicarbonate transport system substrate-binding protein